MGQSRQCRRGGRVDRDEPGAAQSAHRHPQFGGLQERHGEVPRRFPDARYAVEDQIAEGDKVVVRWTLRATQATEYQGHPPNGKMMSVTGISIFRLAGGKIQEITVNMDRLGQMEQLGWLPAAPPSK